MEELKAYVIVVQTIALIASVLLAARFYFKYHIQREKNSRLWQALKNLERKPAVEKEQQHDHIRRHVA